MTSKEIVKKVVELYVKRSRLGELIYVGNAGKTSMEYLEKQILESLPEIIPIVEKPEKFIKIMKELIMENNEQFQIAFAEPFLEDFISILLFDMKRKKVMDNGKIDFLMKNLEN